MKSIYIFGHLFNGLEFVTYILIPTAIFLVIMLYLASNMKIIVLIFQRDDSEDILDKFNDSYLLDKSGLLMKLTKMEENNKKANDENIKNLENNKKIEKNEIQNEELGIEEKEI